MPARRDIQKLKLQKATKLNVAKNRFAQISMAALAWKKGARVRYTGMQDLEPPIRTGILTGVVDSNGALEWLQDISARKIFTSKKYLGLEKKSRSKARTNFGKLKTKLLDKRVPNLALVKARAANDAFKVYEALEAGADPNWMSSNRDGYSGTQLYWASLFGKYDVVEVLLDGKANVNRGCRGKCESPLFAAARRGHAKVAKLLIENRADVHKTSGDNWTPTFLAAYEGKPEVLKVLLKANGSVNMRTGAESHTPLWTACYYGNADCARILLKASADMSITGFCEKDANDRYFPSMTTPLEIAKTRNRTKILEVFRQERGIDC